MSSGGTQTTDQGEQVIDQAILLEGARHRSIVVESTTQEITPGTEDSTPSAESLEKQEVVTIVEFSDFQCPACKAAQPAVEAVKSAFPGQIDVVYRHFPLDSIHPNARLAAIASEAVASIDETIFWPFHDKLFTEQQAWSDIRSRDELKDTFATYAVELGLDRTQFLEKMEDNSIADSVNLDVTLGSQLGVNSTPTFYVNGIKTSAQQLLSTVETVLNK